MREIRLRSEKLDWREIEGEIVVLDGQQSVYLTVNRPGALLWPDLAGGTTEESLVARLTEAFEISREQATEDVNAFLALLRSEGLVEEREAPGP